MRSMFCRKTSNKTANEKCVFQKHDVLLAQILSECEISNKTASHFKCTVVVKILTELHGMIVLKASRDQRFPIDQAVFHTSTAY